MKIKYRPIIQKVRTFALNDEPTLQAVILTPEDYHYITQAEDVDIMERVILSEVTMRSDYDINTWKEITEEEAEEIKAAQNARFEEQKEYYNGNNINPYNLKNKNNG